MGANLILPTQSPFFQGQAFQPLSAPWLGFFANLLGQQAVAQAVSIGILAIVQDLSGGGTALVTTAAPAGVALLFVVLRQDGAGGTGVEWDTMFSSNTPSNINRAGMAVTVFQFLGMEEEGIWQFAGVSG